MSFLMLLSFGASALGVATLPTPSRISPLCRRLHGWDGVSPYNVLAPPSSRPKARKARQAVLQAPKKIATRRAASRHSSPQLQMPMRLPLLWLHLFFGWVVAQLAARRPLRRD